MMLLAAFRTIAAVAVVLAPYALDESVATGMSVFSIAAAIGVWVTGCGASQPRLLTQRDGSEYHPTRPPEEAGAVTQRELVYPIGYAHASSAAGLVGRGAEPVERSLDSVLSRRGQRLA